jgi:hypothetical protein
MSNRGEQGPAESGFSFEDGESKKEGERVAQYFIPTCVPAGGAPDAVRAKWIGVLLPVREFNVDRDRSAVTIGANVVSTVDVKVQPSRELVRVEVPDAIGALRHTTGCEGAADWWQEWDETKDPMFGSTLMFQRGEGDLYSAQELDGVMSVDEL